MIINKDQGINFIVSLYGYQRYLIVTNGTNIVLQATSESWNRSAHSCIAAARASASLSTNREGSSLGSGERPPRIQVHPYL